MCCLWCAQTPSLSNLKSKAVNIFMSCSHDPSQVRPERSCTMLNMHAASLNMT